MTVGNPPKYDELEISVFGPGRGECILVHMGYNEWCMIDSCIGTGKALPAAVEYLTELGGASLEGVLLVLATHWHDDHIRGIADSLHSFPNARFACSSALKNQEFLTLVQLQTKSLQGDSGVDEFGKIVKILKERGRLNVNQKNASPVFAIQDRLLLQRNEIGRLFPATITALSPSDVAVTLALSKIACFIPKPNQLQRRITNRPPNEASVVLFVEVGCRTALFGADLEHSGRAEEGWLAILDSAQTRPQPAQVYKVPHHGSPNADCIGVWQRLLVPEPIAILTPFTSGKGLPQQQDIDRLKSRTPHLYCTSDRQVRLPKRHDKVVEKKLKDRTRIAIDGNLGHVRLRWSATDAISTPQIEMFNGAFKA